MLVDAFQLTFQLPAAEPEGLRWFWLTLLVEHIWNASTIALLDKGKLMATFCWFLLHGPWSVHRHVTRRGKEQKATMATVRYWRSWRQKGIFHSNTLMLVDGKSGGFCCPSDHWVALENMFPSSNAMQKLLKYASNTVGKSDSLYYSTLKLLKLLKSTSLH